MISLNMPSITYMYFLISDHSYKIIIQHYIQNIFIKSTAPFLEKAPLNMLYVSLPYTNYFQTNRWTDKQMDRQTSYLVSKHNNCHTTGTQQHNISTVYSAQSKEEGKKIWTEKSVTSIYKQGKLKDYISNVWQV